MTDRRTVLAVVLGVAACALSGIIGIVLLAVTGRPIPDVLGVITGGALTGLTALLASTRSSPPGEVTDAKGGAWQR